jgi:hypothetical protein
VNGIERIEQLLNGRPRIANFRDVELLLGVAKAARQDLDEGADYSYEPDAALRMRPALDRLDREAT